MPIHLEECPFTGGAEYERQVAPKNIMKKLYCKFAIQKLNDKPIDPLAQYFALRIDNDSAARIALLVYANEMAKQGELEFANQLTEWVAKFDK